MLSRSKFLKNSAILMVLTLISRILGLVREMVKSHFLGTSVLSDLYVLAFFIPNLLRRLFAENAMSVAFVPTFKGYLHEGDSRSIAEFVSAIMTVLLLLVSLVVLAGIFFAEPLVRAAQARPEEVAEAALLTRMMFPYLAFVSVAALFQGILNSSDEFAPSGFVPILFNLAVIGVTLFFHDSFANPARAMAAGVFLGGLLQALFQLPFVFRYRYGLKLTGLRKAFTHPGTRKVGRLLAPTLVGMAAYQFNNIVSTLLAKRCSPGVLSSINYSLRLQELILGIFVVSLSTVLLTELTTNIKKERWDEMNTNLDFSLKIVLLVTIPIIFFFTINNTEMVRLVFQSNQFDENSVALTSAAFAFHIPGIFFVSMVRILNPAFYAQEDTRKPAIAGMISVGTNVLLCLFLYKNWEGRGIALATTLSAMVNAAVLMFFLRKNPRIDLARVGKGGLFYLSKMLLYSAVALVPLLLVKERVYGWFMGRGKIIGLGVPFFLCAFLYFGLGAFLMWITRDKEFRRVIRYFRERGRPQG